ncbi:twin-arginine translocase TatA/TatE family subunit [Anaeromyxobacter sp. PSR-1]|uniref:twin-arginine translocase TatA/TatE family subunit n=1 Tax=unclassified Anaeromyxobacter TaxID=2620896 RepID=UPI0005E4C03A|nr:twin-arginine translocase TatA/TatE family subunit [Anaeromyxobacter sp. PSR-1]GAO03891.1 sec-independent protein translocase protein TatA [Anaeromyxobacter sp. PSR-1]
MGELGMGELLIILVVVVLLFGTKKLPQLGEGLGKAIRNFKAAASGNEEAPAGPPAAQPRELPRPPEPPAGGPA